MRFICDMTDSSVDVDSFIRVSGAFQTTLWENLHLPKMTHSYARHDSFICETWLIHMRDDPFVRGMTRSCVAWRIHMRFAVFQAVLTMWEDLRECNTLQHTAPQCNTLHYTDPAAVLQIILHTTQYATLQHTATHCNTLQHPATPCNTLQHTATHCNTLQYTAPHYNT